MEFCEVPLTKISVDPNRRKISKSTVSAIADSLLDIGLQNPIALTKKFRLIHGRHRLEAYRLLGWNTIPSTIHDVDDIHAQIAEIDENIQRKQLTAVEEAKALAKRKELYLVLHPETKHGGAPGNKGKGRGKIKVAESATLIPFVDDAAAKTGKSKRTIRDEVALGQSLSDDIAQKVAETPIANKKSELKKLAKLEPEEQQAVVKLLCEGEVTSVSEAIKCDDEAAPEPADVLLKRLKSLIDKWRREFRSSTALAASVLEAYVKVLKMEGNRTCKSYESKPRTSKA